MHRPRTLAYEQLHVTSAALLRHHADRARVARILYMLCCVCAWAMSAQGLRAEDTAKKAEVLRTALAAQVLGIEVRVNYSGTGCGSAETSHKSFATGFMVSDRGQVLTVQHLLDNVPPGVQLCFWAHWQTPDSPPKPMRAQLDGATVEKAEASDVLLISFKTKPSDKYLSFEKDLLSGADIAQSRSLYFVGYDGPDQLETDSDMEKLLLRAQYVPLSTVCATRKVCDMTWNTVAGNSGSPVVTEDGKVAGIVVKDHPHDSSRGRFVHISALEEFLRTHSLLPTAKAQEPTVVIKSIQGSVGGPLVKAQVWLDVIGDKTFIIDSVRINHRHSNLMSGASGGFGSDADEKIVYEPGTDKVHTFDKYIRLNPNDSTYHVALLRLEAVPKGTVSGASTTDVRLLFRSDDGVHSGELRLIEPSAAQLRLAQLAGSDVAVASGLEITNPDRGWLEKSAGLQVVDAKGLQRVVHSTISNALVSASLTDGVAAHATSFDTAGRWLHPSQSPPPAVQKIDIRQQINARLQSLNRFDLVKGLAGKGDPTAFELCVWMGELCADQIYAPEKIAADSSLRMAAAIHHLLAPSPRILPLISVPTKYGWSSDDTFWIALAIAPPDGTVQALLNSAAKQPKALKSLYLLRHRLSQKELLSVATLAKSAFTREDSSVPKDFALQLWLAASPSLEDVVEMAWAHVDTLRKKAGQSPWIAEAAESSVSCVASMQTIANLSTAGLNSAYGLDPRCYLGAAVWPTRAALFDQTATPLIELSPDSWRFDCEYDTDQVPHEPKLTLDWKANAGQQALVERLESAGKLTAVVAATKSSGRSGAAAWRLVSLASDVKWAKQQLAGRCKGSRDAAEIMRALTRLHMRSPDGVLAQEFNSCGGVTAEIDTGSVIEALWAAPVPGAGETLRAILATAEKRPAMGDYLQKLSALALRARPAEFAIETDGEEYKQLSQYGLPFVCHGKYPSK